MGCLAALAIALHMILWAGAAPVAAANAINPGFPGKRLVRVRLSREDFTELAASHVTITLDPGIPGPSMLQRDVLLAPVVIMQCSNEC